MSTLRVYLRIQLMTLVFGIVGPIFLVVYFAAQPDTTKLVPYVTLCLLRGERPRLTRGTKLADWI